MNRLFQSLFRKDEKYALIWSYIVSLHEYLENIRLDIPNIIAKFGIPRTTLLRIIQFGCTKLDIRYSLKNGVIQFHYEMKKNDDPKQIRIDLGEADTPVLPASDAAEAIINQKKKTSKEMANDDFVKLVIQHFNERTGKRASYTILHNKTLIIAKRNQGYTLQDCFHVIDVKTAEWENNIKMMHCIRISTFFGGKFDDYLNQKGEDNTMKMHSAIANANPESRLTKLSEVMNHFDDIAKQEENG